MAPHDRDDKDGADDDSLSPAARIAYCGVQTGARVAEIFAGRGTTTELLARAVGPAGKVYGQNPKEILEMYFEEDWSKLLAKPVNANVVRVVREFDDPLPPEATRLDLVFSIRFRPEFDEPKIAARSRMHKAIFAALKSGGVYCLIDDDAVFDHELRQRRVDKAVTERERRETALHRAVALRDHRELLDFFLRKEVEKVGFRFEDDDTRVFAVRFVKP